MPQNPLTYAVKLATGFCATEKDLPELRCVKVDLSGDTPALVAFDRTGWVKVFLAGVVIDEPGTGLIPGAEWFRWLNAGSAAHPVEVKCSVSAASMTNGGATCKIPALDPAKHPDPTRRTTDRSTAVVRASDLLASIKSVTFAATKADVQKQRYDVVSFDIDDKGLTLVATDTKVVSVVHTPCPVNGANIAELIPLSQAHALATLLPSVGDGDASVHLNKYECVVQTERFEWGSRLVNQPLFPWRKIIATWDADSKEKIAAPVAEMSQAIRQCSAADPSNLRMLFDFSPGKLTLSTTLTKSVLEIPGCEHSMRFWFDWEYMVDLLNRAGRDTISIEWGAGSKVIIVRIGDHWRYMGVTLLEEGE